MPKPERDVLGCSARVSPYCTDTADHIPADDDVGRFHWRCDACHWLITLEQEREALEAARQQPCIAVRRIDLRHDDIIVREIDDEWVVIPARTVIR